jgi:hypothetical protein
MSSTAPVYPTSQSFKPYYDTSTTSDSASVAGEEEDTTLLEKSTMPMKSKKRNTRLCLFSASASVISCFISLLTATLVVVLLLLLTNGHPITYMKQSQLNTILKDQSMPTSSLRPQDLAIQDMHCGSTPAEARALGCIFDVMSFAWTPPACYDHAFSQEFLARNGPWIFYLDHNATMPLPFDTLSDYEIVWTEHSYHVVHCLYAWERIHQAYLGPTATEDMGKRKLLPREMGSINHTEHCIGLVEDVAQKGVDGKIVNAIAYLVYDGCVDLN